ncbi:MAG: J domain-containing protein [Bacteroidetes bacterium]|nr:J domain-containing protein [Bacteroidota bacterium]
MALKNYYACLGVAPSAPPDVIKQAYRSLVKKYHPDKAPENPFAAAHFTEVQEAYVVLSDSKSRAAYDRERWLLGLHRANEALVAITPEWVGEQAARLKDYLATLDTYHMDHALLRDYLLFLLRNEHLSVLQHDPERRAALLSDVLICVRPLHQAFLPEVLSRCYLLAGTDLGMKAQVDDCVAARAAKAQSERMLPVLVVCIAVLLLLVIYLLVRH